MKPMDAADMLLNALHPDQVTALRAAAFTEIATLPCYPILKATVLYQHPAHTAEFVSRTINAAWNRLNDPTPTGDQRVPIHPVPGELSDRAKKALEYIQSQVVWDKDKR